MKKKTFAVPEYTTAEEIKTIRKNLGLTQGAFATLLRCSRPTIERWERSKEPIKGPIVLLLHMMNNHADEVADLIVPAKELPIRMWYMYREKPCTLIDVNESKREIRIKNYMKNIMFCAFGSKAAPTFEDYEAFIESRCFPRERDKMKLILREMNLPFNDPFMIIEKTEGHMAEDDFWIKIER